MEIVVDLVVSALILGMTYALMSEGIWGATLMFFNVLFGGIIAFNFYEPLARLIDSTGIGWGFSDTLSLLLIFIVATLILRLTTETLAPSMIRFPNPIYHLGRIVFGLLTSATTVAILLLAFQCAPVHKKIFGVIDYQTKVPFKLGLERMWLAFFQYTTGQVFAAYDSGMSDPFKEYGTSNVFDPKAKWLLDHQDARPYGTDTVLGNEGGAEGGQGGAAGGAAPAAPGAAPGMMPGPNPGMPGPNPGMPGPAPGMPGAAPGAMPGASPAAVPPAAGASPNEPKVIGPGPGGGVVIPGTQ